ncbi:hypothetical protein Bca4012_022680 [Brassica carinata]
MPLGERGGWERSESRYCGVETDFSDDVPSLLSFHITTGGFDYVLAPLMDPSYRPSLVEGNGLETRVLPVSGSDLVLSPSQWSSHVVGKISSWIDLDSEDEVLRMDSETTLKQEIAWATHLSLQACLLPTPKGTSCANYARCVNQILQGLTTLQLWLRVPLVKSGGGSVDATSEGLTDSWELWNSFRLLCEHDSKLSVALDVMSTLPSENSLGRWMGESVRAAILSTDSFLTNARGYPCLSKRHQKLIAGFFDHAVQVVVSGKPVHSLPKASDSNTEGTQRHPLRSYLDYVAYLFQKMEPLPEQERIEPLMDNLEAQTYETFERDSIKYIQYQRAVAKALVDRVPDEKASELTTVLMVVGAGRGPLVRASLQAAEETGRKMKVYAVEKNPNAVVTLHNLVKMEGWEAIVTIISCDMRFWSATEKADILVSELLGSFGDNELSPECLDGAQRYTSFIQPVTASKLYNDVGPSDFCCVLFLRRIFSLDFYTNWQVKAHKDLAHFETAYVVKLHSVANLAPSQSVFTFTHPNFSTKANNQRYKKLRFNLPSDAGSALVHGFAGYFDSVLYKDVHLGIEPTTATPNMFSWFPIFFPLRKPVEVHPDSPLEVHFWRCCGSSKVWYEWSVSSPTPSPMHNTNGRSYWVGL